MQEIIEETGCSKYLNTVIDRYGINNPFIVCGKSAYGLSKQGLDVKSIRNSAIFSEYSSNPKYDEIMEGVSLFNNGMFDGFVAIGGGSAIDVAKCIKIYASNSISLPFIAVPTTAGTGSESTCFAVMYKDSVKQSVEHQDLLPECVLLDYSLLESLSDFQKKCTVMDALCQGIESYWAVKSTPDSKMFAQKSISLIIDNMAGYITGDMGAAGNIMRAANYAGQAINITRTTAPHAMSYKITSEFGLPHGYAVALCLPKVWAYMNSNMDKCVDYRGTEYLQSTFDAVALLLGASCVDEAISRLESLLLDIGLLPLPKEVIVSNDTISLLVESVNVDRLINNPIKLDKDALEEIYRNVLGEKHT